MTGPRAGSRKATLLALKKGECAIFAGKPGERTSNLMRSIAATFRNGESLGTEGFTQSAGIGVFHGELARPLVKVTRLAPPKRRSKLRKQQ
jgi:hypothetical protein